MTQALTTSVTGFLPENPVWQKWVGTAILTLLLIQIITTPGSYACPA